jgi:hypothetical protein
MISYLLRANLRRCYMGNMSEQIDGACASPKLIKWQRQAPVYDETWKLEYSVHAIPPRILKELRDVFPGVELENGLIVPTFQVHILS